MSRVIFRNGPFDGSEYETDTPKFKYISIRATPNCSDCDSIKDVLQKLLTSGFIYYRFLNIINGDYYYEWVINPNNIPIEDLHKTIYD